MDAMNTTEQLRDNEGRYAVGLEAMCVCGCQKGEHAAGPKGRSIGECLACEGTGRTCHKFRKVRAR